MNFTKSVIVDGDDLKSKLKKGIDKLAGFKWQGALDMTLAVSGIDVPAITDQIKTAIGKIISDEINTQLANRGVGDSPFRVGPPGTLNQNPNQ